jgi:hypothetical protein
MFNHKQTVISQYGSSPVILGVIDRDNQAVDPESDITNFYHAVKSLTTAFGFGLDIIGRIVGVSRVVPIASFAGYMGFKNTANDFVGFNDAPMKNITIKFNGTYVLSDDAFRKLILLKAFANLSNTGGKALNSLLGLIFAGRGRSYVNNLGNMIVRYTFEFELEPYEISILAYSGAIPKPTGVAVYIFQRPTLSFGFREAGDAYPFWQGTFLSQGVQIAI